MRRRRSDTIDAENFDEYLRMSKNPQQNKHTRTRRSLPDSCLVPLPCGRTSSNILPSSLSPFHLSKPSQGKAKISQVSTTANYWEDIDFENTSETNSQLSINTLSTRVSDSQAAIDIEEQEQNYNINSVKIMVIGAKSTGRHLLLNSAFESEEMQQEDAPEYEAKGPMDLVVKKSKGIGCMNVFKFWVKEAGREDFRQLFNTYYRSVGMYVFVYQVGNRASFECLEQAIKEAQTEAGFEKFEGILIGGHTEEGTRKVGYEEAEELAKRYGLSGLMETDFLRSGDLKELLQALFPSK